MAPEIDETHDPRALSWVGSANGHPDFPIQNLPFGVFSVGGGAPRGGAAIGDHVLDLAELGRTGLIQGQLGEVLAAASKPALNEWLGLADTHRRALRRALFALLLEGRGSDTLNASLRPATTVTMHRPAAIGGYTDFFAGIHHARNAGKLFRPDNPLLPNYKYVPIGYHGRTSSIRVSGAAVRRPNGQRRTAGSEEPQFGPSLKLDYELELGLWISRGNSLGDPIRIEEAGRCIAGICLLNDWSARDLQAWEYQPLGPFLAKNFMTTISPWIVTAEALAPYRVAQPARPPGDPAPLPYLHSPEDQRWGAFAIELDVFLQTRQMRSDNIPPFQLSRGSATHLYWTAAQLITHHTSNGCELQAGDLLGTGTISGPTSEGFGSLLEHTSGGERRIRLPSGETRGFLEDGDTVEFRAYAAAPGRARIGFGPCSGQVKPSIEVPAQ